MATNESVKADGLSEFQVDAMNRAREIVKNDDGEPSTMMLQAAIQMFEMFADATKHLPACEENPFESTIAVMVIALRYGAELRSLGLI